MENEPNTIDKRKELSMKGKIRSSGCIIEDGHLLCKECGCREHKTLFDASSWQRREVKKVCCECGNILRLVIDHQPQPAAGRKEG